MKVADLNLQCYYAKILASPHLDFLWVTVKQNKRTYEEIFVNDCFGLAFLETITTNLLLFSGIP